MFQLTLIFYPHHTDMRSGMLYTNGSFEICQERMFVKLPNRRLQQLLVVENKTILQQLKLSTLYMMFQLTLIFYPHHTGMCSEMFYTNGSFEICQERMFVKQRRKHSLSSYLLPKKNIYTQAKIGQIYA